MAAAKVILNLSAQYPGASTVSAEGVSLEPLPETEEALDEYLEEDDSDLRAVLMELGRRAVELVPSCVGLSLGMVKDGLTFTLVATAEQVATIDAAQYL